MEIEDMRRIGQEIDRFEIGLIERVRQVPRLQYRPDDHSQLADRALLEDMDHLPPEARLRVYRAFLAHLIGAPNV